LVERERAKIVGPTEAFEVLVAHAAHVNAELHGVPAFDPTQVIRELDGLRLGDAVFVASDRRIVAGVVAEIEDREGAGGRMVTEVQAGQSEGGDCCRALHRKSSLELPKRKAEAGLVYEIVGDQIVMRSDDVIVVFGVAVRWEKIVDGIQRSVGQGLCAEMFPAPAHEHGLLGRDGAVEAHIETVGVAGRRGLLQVVGLRSEIGGTHVDIGRGKIVVEQARGDGTDTILRVDALAAARDLVPRVGITGEGIDQWSGKRREIALTHRGGGHKEKKWSRKASAIGFEVRKEKGFGFAVGEFRKNERTTEAATERVVGLMRLVAGVPHLGVERVVLKIFEKAAVELLAATLGGNRNVAELGSLEGG